MTGKVFKKITNDDIYREIQEIKKSLVETHERNSLDHAAIIQRQERTNGKVKLSFWVATTAMTMIVVVIGLLFSHV